MSASSCARSCYYANWSSERDSDSGGIFSNPRDDPAGQQARRMYAIEQIRLCIFLLNITIIVQFISIQMQTLFVRIVKLIRSRYTITRCFSVTKLTKRSFVCAAVKHRNIISFTILVPVVDTNTGLEEELKQDYINDFIAVELRCYIQSSQSAPGVKSERATTTIGKGSTSARGPKYRHGLQGPKRKIRGILTRRLWLPLKMSGYGEICFPVVQHRGSFTLGIQLVMNMYTVEQQAVISNFLVLQDVPRIGATVGRVRRVYLPGGEKARFSLQCCLFLLLFIWTREALLTVRCSIDSWHVGYSIVV